MIISKFSTLTRRWYKTARWRTLRRDILARDQFTCQVPECGQFFGDATNLIAHHRKPPNGNESLFWNPGNLQCVCKKCHDDLLSRENAEDAKPDSGFTNSWP